AVAPHEAPRTCRWAGGTLIVGPRPHSGVAAPAGGADPLPVRPVRCRTDGATSWRTIRYAYVSLRRRQHAGLGTSARHVACRARPPAGHDVVLGRNRGHGHHPTGASVTGPPPCPARRVPPAARAWAAPARCIRSHRHAAAARSRR